MLTAEQLKQAVHKDGVTKTDASLLCVAAAGGRAATSRKVKDLAIAAGVKGAKKINFSAHLASAEDKVFKTPDGWELTEQGKKYVAGLAASVMTTSPSATEAQALRALLPKLSNKEARAFLTEAIVCAEQSLHRAAVVLSWVGAVAILQDAVVHKHLGAFNAEAARRDRKWTPAKTPEDLGRLKEHTFLQVAASIGAFGRSTKQELEGCLRLRNSCGHPNSLNIGPNKVAAHLEMLALNVFAKFS